VLKLPPCGGERAGRDRVRLKVIVHENLVQFGKGSSEVVLKRGSSSRFTTMAWIGLHFLTYCSETVRVELVDRDVDRVHGEDEDAKKEESKF